ncbi:quinone oxidoreductase [Dacryopinax primogenitus]|uniref:Quinone oxidoreductase n=1 Tax=Dacryopinax primogenitus (strain DJM 731) TaxID=1858805 RepID=M5GE32_DACPD|nr:quinone oxidoreductase [Dacryopinax primogenitus]EJU02933.1 quinone oxidoreductase [Dacryopinax primogenitus]
MRAVLIKGGIGSADDLYIGNYENPTPSKGEILVKIVAAGVNRLDIMQRSRGPPALPSASKDILGVEFSGRVEGLGEGVSDFQIGDEVLGLAPGAAYAEYITVRSGTVMKKPADLGFVEAASIPEVWFTAFQAIVLIAHVTANDTVLVHAGASGVGLAAIQLARFLGVKTVYATAGSDEKANFLSSIKNGASHAVNYKKQDFAVEIDKATNGKGVDVIVDFVGQDYFSRNINLLRTDGRLVLLATLSGKEIPNVDLGPILYKRIHIGGSTLRTRSLEYQAKLTSRFVDEVLPYIKGETVEESPLKTYLYTVYPWQDVAEAHKDMEANKNTGKIMLRIV